ncbi:hypothetical protein B0H19DRAFT_284525 [Mycena capillaripes]|nr:hypothetical protein B0H19DRAFT_284525 [Mycena capillaripes]
MWAVFITAAPPSAEALNRAFLLIQDSDPSESQWTLLTSKHLPSRAPPATPLPLPDVNDTRNDFASTSPAEIHADWVVIDEKGLNISTCLVCAQVYSDPGDERGEHGTASDPGAILTTAEFRACRLPYEMAWGAMTNLDIANLGAEELGNTDAVEQDDCSWIQTLHR